MAKHTNKDRAISYPYHMIEGFNARDTSKRELTLARRNARRLKRQAREHDDTLIVARTSFFKGV